MSRVQYYSGIRNPISFETDDKDLLVFYDHLTFRCPLCNTNKVKSYYCADCVKHGDFYHSKLKLPERFADKKLTLIRAQANLADLQEQIEAQYHQKTKHNKLHEEIDRYKEKNELYRNSISTIKENIKRLKHKASAINSSNNQTNQHHPDFRKKILKLMDDMRVIQKKCEEKQEKFELMKSDTSTQIYRNLAELRQYIFPIERVELPKSASPSSQYGYTSMALEEATRTICIQGRWVYANPPLLETQYRIVAPVLPGNGNYSAYSRYPYFIDQASQNHRHVDLVTDNRSEALNIVAGLMYLQQFVSAMALYLDVHLPKKVSPRDFWGRLEEADFFKAVARLNYNVRYLCQTQDIPEDLLHSHLAISNIIQLYDKFQSSYGRDGPVLFPPSQVICHSSIDSEAYLDCSDSEGEEGSISSDWETVTIDMPESRDVFGAPIQLPNSGYMSSIFSAFKGFTNR